MTDKLDKLLDETAGELTLEQMRAAVIEARASAADYVRRYAATHAPRVRKPLVEGLCGALGDISVDEACTVLDREQRRLVR